MLQTLGLLLVCQLVSEFVASGLSLPISGPALGLVVLLAALVVRSSLAGALRPTCHVIMAHLSLMFLPRQRWGYWQFRRSLFGLGQVAGGTDPFHDFVDACNRGHIYHHETSHL